MVDERTLHLVVGSRLTVTLDLDRETADSIGPEKMARLVRSVTILSMDPRYDHGCHEVSSSWFMRPGHFTPWIPALEKDVADG